MKKSERLHVEPIRPIDGILKKEDGRLPGRWRKVRFQDEIAPKELCANTLSAEEQEEMEEEQEAEQEEQ